MSDEELAVSLSLASEAAALTNHVTWAELMGKGALAIEGLLSRCTECREATDKAIDNINKAWHGKYEKDVPKWIPASERLPDKGGTYLIACGNGLITTDAFMVWPGRVKTYSNWDDYGGGIKYWMEIPKPPNEFFESLKRGLEQAINGETREMTIEVEDGSD